MTDPLDRNKTELTHKITALASIYLDSIGCKPVETEVMMPDGTVADIASFFYPTQTELKVSKLLKRFIDEKGLEDNERYSIFHYRYGDILTVSVEVKTSLADLKKDIGRKYTHDSLRELGRPTHLSYLCVPSFLKEEAEKVYGWGKIICSENGERILKIEAPFRMFALHPHEVISVIAQVAIRRDHRTRYRAMRDLMKTYRAKGY